MDKRNIQRLDNYTNNKAKNRWKCLVDNCNYIWITTPSSVLNNNTGCAKCANQINLTNEFVDTKLFNRNIERLDNIINAREKIRWKCKINSCLCIWRTTPDSIFNGGTGCPSCAGILTLTNDIVDKKLKFTSIKRIGNYINIDRPIEWLCLKCNFTWKTAPNHILNNNTGCAKCYGNISLTNEMVDLYLIDKKIKRIEDVCNAHSKIEWQCMNDNCLNSWSATINNILHNNTGCPLCKNKNEKFIYDLFVENNIEFEYQKNIKQLFPNETRNYRIDFYIPKLNMIIEYNGAQHYRPVCFGGIAKKRAETNFVKQQERDCYIRNACQEHIIKLLEIDGRIFNNSELKRSIKEIFIPYLESIL